MIAQIREIPGPQPTGRSYSGIHYGGGKIIYFGGGHIGHAGNDVEVFDCATDRWASLYPAEICGMFPGDTASALAVSQRCASIYGGSGSPVLSPLGRPFVCHTYQQIAWDPVRRVFLANLRPAGLFELDLTGTWKRVGAAMTGDDVQAHVMFDADPRGMASAVTGGTRNGVYRLTPARTWTRIGDLPTRTWTTAYSTYQPSLDAHLVRGWNSWWRYTAAGSWLTLGTGPDLDSFASGRNLVLGLRHRGGLDIEAWVYENDMTGWHKIQTAGDRALGFHGIDVSSPMVRYDPPRDRWIYVRALVNGDTFKGGVCRTFEIRVTDSPLPPSPVEMVLKVGKPGTGNPYSTLAAAAAAVKTGGEIWVEAYEADGVTQAVYREGAANNGKNVIVRGMAHGVVPKPMLLVRDGKLVHDISDSVASWLPVKPHFIPTHTRPDGFADSYGANLGGEECGIENLEISDVKGNWGVVATVDGVPGGYGVACCSIHNIGGNGISGKHGKDGDIHILYNVLHNAARDSDQQHLAYVTTRGRVWWIGNVSSMAPGEGHLGKLRCAEVVVVANVHSDYKQIGSACSQQLDLPWGTRLGVVAANILVKWKDPATQLGSSYLVKYNAEADSGNSALEGPVHSVLDLPSYRPLKLAWVNNIEVGYWDANPATWLQLHRLGHPGPDEVLLQNNALVGRSNRSNWPALPQMGGVDLWGVAIDGDPTHYTLRVEGNAQIEDPAQASFVDELAGDFRLRADSPVLLPRTPLPTDWHGFDLARLVAEARYHPTLGASGPTPPPTVAQMVPSSLEAAVYRRVVVSVTSASATGELVATVVSDLLRLDLSVLVRLPQDVQPAYTQERVDLLDGPTTGSHLLPLGGKIPPFAGIGAGIYRLRWVLTDAAGTATGPGVLLDAFPVASAGEVSVSLFSAWGDSHKG